MVRKGQRPITAESLVDEVRFLLKTLLRDDLFGDSVTLDEAEKLLETSLSVRFSDYCTFLKKQGLIQIDGEQGTVTVLPEGKATARGGPDPDLVAALAVHFADRIVAGRKTADGRKGADGRKTDDGPKAREQPTAIPSNDDPGVTQPIQVRRPVAVLDDSGVRRMRAAPGGSPLGGASSTSPATLSAGHDVGERYELGEAIGEGSLGQVFVATDRVLGRAVAVKQLSHVFDFVTYIPAEELSHRIREAALAQAGLEHPHILDVTDLDFSRPRPQVFTRYAAGGNLRQRLDRAAAGSTGRLPVDVAVRIFLQCVHALDHAHRTGVVHGGLKPENVLFDAAGNVLVSDFGMSRVTAKGALTGPPVYVGAGATSYMPPEQLHEEQLGPAADVYAVGILLYQMLTGQLPGRRSPMPSAKNPDVPPGLDDVFDRMTQDAATERYPDLEAVLDELYGGALPREHVPARGLLLLNLHDPFPGVLPRTEEPTLDEKVGGHEEAARGDPELLDDEAAGWAGEGADLVSAEADAIDEGAGAP